MGTPDGFGVDKLTMQDEIEGGESVQQLATEKDAIALILRKILVEHQERVAEVEQRLARIVGR